MRIFFKDLKSGLFLGACVPNLKFKPLAILELLAFNDKKMGVTWLWPRSLFANFFRGHVGSLSGRVRAKFKVRTLSHFGAVGIYRPKIYGVMWPWPRHFLPSFDILGLAAPRDIVWTMNRYNRSTDNAREVFQYSHWKAMCRCQFVVKYGKIGDTLSGFSPPTKGIFPVRVQTSVPNFIKIRVHHRASYHCSQIRDDVQLRSEADKPSCVSQFAVDYVRRVDIDWHTSWLTGRRSAIMSILTRTDPNLTNHVAHGIRRFLPVVSTAGRVCYVIWFSLTSHICHFTLTGYRPRLLLQFSRYVLLYAHSMSIAITLSILPGHAHQCPYLAVDSPKPANGLGLSV